MLDQLPVKVVLVGLLPMATLTFKAAAVLLVLHLRQQMQELQAQADRHFLEVVLMQIPFIIQE